MVEKYHYKVKLTSLHEVKKVHFGYSSKRQNYIQFCFTVTLFVFLNRIIEYCACRKVDASQEKEKQFTAKKYSYLIFIWQTQNKQTKYNCLPPGWVEYTGVCVIDKTYYDRILSLTTLFPHYK